MRPHPLSRVAPFVLLLTAACGQKQEPQITPEPSVPAQAPVAPASVVAGQPPPQSADYADDFQAPGVVEMRSKYDVPTTVARLRKLLEEKGLKELAVVDHSANAKGVGAELRPTTLIIFGNPKAGTQLMQVRQRAALDLPMKALVYEAENGNTYLAFNRPSYVAERHGVEGKDELLDKMMGAVDGLANQAAGFD